jgi:hypothetical protein
MEHARGLFDTDGDLFDGGFMDGGTNDNARAHARRGDPDTSHAAARDMSPHVRGIQKAVLAYAVECGWAGFTDPDLGAHFQSLSSTYRSRRAELVEQGLIKDSGERRAVEGRGRRFAVWMVTGEGETEALRLGLMMPRAA